MSRSTCRRAVLHRSRLGRRVSRIRAAGALSAALAGVLLVPASAQSANPAGPDRVEPRLRAALDAVDADEWIAVGVTLRADDLPAAAAARRAAIASRQQRVLDELPDGAFRLRRRYQMLAGLAGWARRSAVDALARRDDVRSVYLDGRVRASLIQGVSLIGADVAHGLGQTGDGVNVAILDTGIDTDHPDLEDDLVAEQCYCSDTHPSPVIGSPCCPNGLEQQSGPGAAEDDAGHGTSVAGIITSGGVVAPPGVAPDAGVVAVRVLGPAGGAFSDIAAGLDWVLVNRDAFTDPIRVVNMSLGDGTEYNDPGSSPCTGSNTADAIAALHAAGISVFVASGNDGFDDGIEFPACVPDATSVGGVYDASLGLVQWCADASCSQILCSDTAVADGFVCHSNSDEILDLLAPDFRTRTSAMGGGVVTSFGGTSAASPYAAGQAALLLAADPGLAPDQVLAALTSSGVTVTNPDNGLSFPRSDVGEAMISLLGECGNGVVEPGEDCDDGGTVDGDCCSSSCLFDPPGAACDDGDACTTVHGCDGSGTCLGTAPPTCDDGNPCTDDSCDPAIGCVFPPNTEPCDDGDACTTGDACDGAGACEGGAPLACSDGTPCTDDSCDPAIGCVFAPNAEPCDDGNACTADDTCVAGTCQAGLPLDCDDGDVCTAESCDEISGCVSTPIPDCASEVPALPGDLPLLLGAALAASARAARRQRRPR